MTTASATTKTQYQWILLLILVATGIGYAIANTVLRRSREAETVLLNKNRQIRAFTQITSDSRKTIEEQLDDILQLGCRLLAMKCGLLLRVEACGSASVLSRYCADHLGGAVFQQAMIDRLSAAAKNTSDAVLATDTLNDRDPELADLLNREHIKTLITSTVCNAGPVSAVVIFMHNKTITADNEINDLTQLIGNKLAVLLDQQETLSQLQNARQAAETANKTRNTFLNHITYKLQTALNAIIGHNELLQEQMRRHNHPQYLNDSNKIGTESRQLLAWISNLLDLTQIETGNMVFTRQRFDIGLVLEQTVKNLEVIATETEHHLQMPRLNDLGPMVGDAAKITRILTSIISFCCSLYGHKKIYLTVWREHDPQVDWLYVEVYKNGSGMSKKRINQLFKLATADSLDREKTVFNAQLDLAISKKLCERLGGDILVDSKPGGGTTFTVCLPCRSLQLNEVGLEAAGSN